MTYVNVESANTDTLAFSCPPDKRYKIKGIQIYNGGTASATVTIKDVYNVLGETINKVIFVGSVPAGGNLIVDNIEKVVGGEVYVNASAPVQVVIDKEVM